ncbi:MAG: hypothetical protein MUF72_20385 [Elainella sp. Prado103]|nr:hypothetical protein [Elainella sp. Prado103]
MIRHIRHQQVYWFCRSCWQEMPLIDTISSHAPVSFKLQHTPAVAVRSLALV